jgi:hypothetical protein
LLPFIGDIRHQDLAPGVLSSLKTTYWVKET